MSEVTSRVAGLSETKRALLDSMTPPAAPARPGHDLSPELYQGTIVPLQPNGTKRPLFVIHATDGSVSYFQYLIRHLGLDQPLFAIQTPGLNDDRTPYGTIQDQAAHYLQEIRKIDPTGAPRIAGYCMGGLPAFEIAQQLLRRGEAIESVIHISPIMERDWDYLESERDLELRAAHDFVFLADKLMGIRLPVDFAAMRASKDRMAYLVEQAIAHRCLPSNLEMTGFQRRVNVYRANLNAMRTYEPTDIRRCRIRVLLLTTRGEQARLDFDSVYTAYLARVASEDIEVTRVDADPVSFINGKEPDLGVTVTALAQIMARP